MKALTLWQPHASLVALALKRIETRGWTTKYRGPLAIHAAARKPRRIWSDELPAVYDPIPMERYLDILEDAHQPGQFAYDWCGPLGAVVATCTLVDVVPIVAITDGQASGAMVDVLADGRLLLWSDPLHPEDIDDQRPYGDFTPGRFAWLLADITRLPEPIPAKGKQGIWEWEPSSPLPNTSQEGAEPR